MKDIPAALKAARAVSTPLVGITTADQAACILAIRASFEEAKAPPMLQQDCVRGFLPVNQAGREAIAKIVPPPDPAFPGPPPGTNLAEALTLAQKLPSRAILFVLNAHLLMRAPDGSPAPDVIQSIMNLRDTFKVDARTLVLLAPVLMLPLELQQDVMTLDEPLPDEPTIRTIIDRQISAYERDTKNTADAPEALRVRATEALSGLAAFPVEQAVAITIKATNSLDLSSLWERKKAFTEQTKGLRFDDAAFRFDDIGGCDQIKRFAHELFEGPEPPRLIVRIDEGEKAFAGGVSASSGDGGVARDAFGVTLAEMEDNEYTGCILVGPGGAGKTLFSRALGATFTRPVLVLDLNAMRGKYVGTSEESVRQAWKIIRAIAGHGGAYLVMTCNELGVLPMPLRRRFTDGVWYFDLPTVDELRPIWRINLQRWKLPDDLEECVTLSANWTGAEIRNVCRNAYRLKRTIRQAAEFVVPAATADADGIEKLRKAAEGHWLSASYPGAYQHPNTRAELPTEAQRGFMES